MCGLSSPADDLTQLIDIIKDHIFIDCLTHPASTRELSLPEYCNKNIKTSQKQWHYGKKNAILGRLFSTNKTATGNVISDAD